MSYTAPVKDMLFNMSTWPILNKSHKSPASRMLAWTRQLPCWKSAPSSPRACWLH
jgi:hypothetical protein